MDYKDIDIIELKKAFKEFTSASQTIENTYENLKSEIDNLKKELKGKNEKLFELSTLLETIIMNMRSAFIAVDSKNNSILKNNIADEYLKNYKDFIDDIIDNKESGVYEFEKDGKHFKCSVDVIDIDKKTIFIYLIDDITIIKNIEKERQRDEKLKLMGEMAANIAHEIRNPLGSIELYTSILKKSLKNNNDLNMTDSILKCTKAINNIISNILVFNRDVNIDIRKHYLADIIDDVVLYLRHLMLSKKIDFRNNIGEDTIVYADSEYLKQVIMNLLHNSIEATQEGGKIKIESKEDNYKTIICIEDNGCGIKPSFFDKLFIPFQTNKAKGTGLGLAICYKIIKAHRGSITPISDGESYTKFIVDLPKSEDYEK